jgi:hypothetical protein
LTPFIAPIYGGIGVFPDPKTVQISLGSTKKKITISYSIDIDISLEAIFYGELIFYETKVWVERWKESCEEFDCKGEAVQGTFSVQPRSSRSKPRESITLTETGFFRGSKIFLDDVPLSLKIKGKRR